MVAVALAGPADGPAWDAFVASRPDGTIFHVFRWRDLIARVFGHAPLYFVARQDGAVVGVLPLFAVKTRLFGHTLISTPFCVYGGPLAVDDAARAALERAAADEMRRRRASAVEFRYREAPETDWVGRPGLYATFRKPIAGDDEANLKAIPRKQRAMVRKGIGNGLRGVVDRDARKCHAVYAESVRNLGTPVFARRWFEAMADAFPDSCDVMTVMDGEAPVASVMNFYWRDEVLPYYGGGTAAARGRAANDFMYWEVMRHAASRGCRLFDFGRSKEGTGAYSFKVNWGFTPAPLDYRFFLPEGGSVPENNPLNPKYRLMIATWKRLPLPVANALGPFVVRGLG